MHVLRGEAGRADLRPRTVPMRVVALIGGAVLAPYGLILFAVPDLQTPLARLLPGIAYFGAGIAAFRTIGIEPRLSRWPPLLWGGASVVLALALLETALPPMPILGWCYLLQGLVALARAGFALAERSPLVWDLVGGGVSTLVGGLLVSGFPAGASAPAFVVAVDLISFGLCFLHGSVRQGSRGG